MKRRFALLVLRAALRLHPREFRERFGADIERDLMNEIEAGGAGVTWRAVVDAIGALRVARGAQVKERRQMQTWLRDAARDLQLALRGLRRERSLRLQEPSQVGPVDEPRGEEFG